jgi:hypothetical protein
MRKSSKYIVVAGALAALAVPAALTVPSAAMAGGTCTTGTTITTGPATGLTAAVDAAVEGNPTGQVNASGCDIGVYDPTGTLSNVTITGAKQYGVYVDTGTNVNVNGDTVSNIGDSPMDGMQYGYGIYYTGGATGAITGNHVNKYQKNGIVVDGAGTSVSVTGNVVTGQPTGVIAQNGIVVENGATATAMSGNIVSGNQYTGKSWTATGILFYQAHNAPSVGAISQANSLSQNQKEAVVVK